MAGGGEPRGAGLLPRPAAPPPGRLRGARRAQRARRRCRARRAASPRRARQHDRRRDRKVAEPARPPHHRRSTGAGRVHLPRPAHLHALRPGPPGDRARVHRPHDPAAAARGRRERQHRRPRHPRHPRRRHHEPLGAVRRPDGDHLAADRRPLDRRDAPQLGGPRGARAPHLRDIRLGGAHLPAPRAQGVHHRGRHLLAHQHHAHRDGRGRPHPRVAGPLGRPGPRRRRRHRGVGAGRALHDVAAQHPLRGPQLRLPDPARDHPPRRAPTPTPAAGSTSARSRRPCSTSRRWPIRSTG